MIKSDDFVDLALACAISDHDGNVQLLVPVLRQQARDLAGKKDFVIEVFRPVEGIAADRRYGAAFNQEPPFPSTRTSSALESLCGPRRGLG
jgi:hypothetical protein